MTLLTLKYFINFALSFYFYRRFLIHQSLRGKVLVFNNAFDVLIACRIEYIIRPNADHPLKASHHTRYIYDGLRRLTAQDDIVSIMYNYTVSYSLVLSRCYINKMYPAS